MNTERDELRDLLQANMHRIDGFERWTFQAPVDLADALLAAGYRRSQAVTTVEELDALPDAVLILTEQGGYWESIKRMDGRNWWKEPGARDVSPSEDLTLPATVLHVGGTQ